MGYDEHDNQTSVSEFEKENYLEFRMIVACCLGKSYLPLISSINDNLGIAWLYNLKHEERELDCWDLKIVVALPCKESTIVQSIK